MGTERLGLTAESEKCRIVVRLDGSSHRKAQIENAPSNGSYQQSRTHRRKKTACGGRGAKRGCRPIGNAEWSGGGRKREDKKNPQHRHQRECASPGHHSHRSLPTTILNRLTLNWNQSFGNFPEFANSSYRSAPISLDRPGRQHLRRHAGLRFDFRALSGGQPELDVCCERMRLALSFRMRQSPRTSTTSCIQRLARIATDSSANSALSVERSRSKDMKGCTFRPPPTLA